MAHTGCMVYAAIYIQTEWRVIILFKNAIFYFNDGLRNMYAYSTRSSLNQSRAIRPTHVPSATFLIMKTTKYKVFRCFIRPWISFDTIIRPSNFGSTTFRSSVFRSNFTVYNFHDLCGISLDFVRSILFGEASRRTVVDWLEKVIDWLLWSWAVYTLSKMSKYHKMCVGHFAHRFMYI